MASIEDWFGPQDRFVRTTPVRTEEEHHTVRRTPWWEDRHERHQAVPSPVGTLTTQHYTVIVLVVVVQEPSRYLSLSCEVLLVKKSAPASKLNSRLNIDQ
jgi:hypothetical protein